MEWLLIIVCGIVVLGIITIIDYFVLWILVLLLNLTSPILNIFGISILIKLPI